MNISSFPDVFFSRVLPNHKMTIECTIQTVNYVLNGWMGGFA